MILPSHTLPRIVVIVLLVVGVPTAFIMLTMKVSEVFPRVGRVLMTIWLSLTYAFIATVVLATFLGSHVAVGLFPIFAVVAIPIAWREVKRLQRSDDGPSVW